MRNLTLLTDFYELTMMQAYHHAQETTGTGQWAVFDMFYRENPSGNSYAVAAGLAQLIEYVKNIRFEDADIEYLRSTGAFNEPFLAYLRNFRFTGDIYAVPEGTVVFPNEPLVRVSAPLAEGQFIETALLNIINHQSLIATKAARVCWAAKGDRVLEFGLRRAQGPDAGIYGARAAMIGGCHGTSNVLAGQLFDVPVRGTHAHSWIMSFDDELSAFRSYAALYPGACILLVDTYDTLKSGVPNAIKVFEEMKARNIPLSMYGIRLDSGDLAYLSKRARIMLDEAGFTDAMISASSDLDEHLITELKAQGAKITLWGVGTNLITSKENPAFGGVYKMAALSEGGKPWVPKIKISENPAKVTNPGVKKVFRLYDTQTGKMKADLIALADEHLNPMENLTIFDPLATWKRMTLPAKSYTVRELLEPVFKDGVCVYPTLSVNEIRTYAETERDTLWDEHKRLSFPQLMPIDLSQELYNLKQMMIAQARS
ncbi:MAG: nicotinate phosphoribosyltransferase [Defluviitaleaceae bacterium]|nr:nicotinate phosphoribosyltransferase [Defluviitaleaceae bacterium]MCL2275673.1 nicotinate phosphoribosyltransferase [Defluviitaleaceae bacterium]